MPSVCFYFQVHQPVRIREYTFFDIGERHNYFNEHLNAEILHKVSDKCYLKANAVLLETLKKMKGQFKIAFSFSGIVLEQLESQRPDVLESFKKLIDTGLVEVLAETYYHSLAFVFSKAEFDRQVKMHSQKIQSLFGVKPTVFRNTELIYNNDLAVHVGKLGYKGILAEGTENVLKNLDTNHLLNSSTDKKIKVLTRNYLLSDDVAFRYSDKNWSEYPLTASRFANKIHRYAEEADVLNLFMDYETFGEHQWQETGIFDFLASLPEKILKHVDFDFKTPSEIVEKYPSKEVYDCPQFSSWADTERDISAWLGNAMQWDAAKKIYEWEKLVIDSGNEELLSIWGKLQCSDNFYYMSTKSWNDGAVHGYFSPFRSPYDAYLHYMNVISDLEIACIHP